MANINFHTEEISPNRWKIVYDEPIELEPDEYLSYHYDENDMPVTIERKKRHNARGQVAST